jgi:hypothetical protein
MKTQVALILVLALLGGGLVLAERQHAAAAPSGRSVLYLIADSERDLTRLPANFTRISDHDEVASGTAFADRFLAQRGKLTKDDEQIEGCVAQVGSRIVRHARRRLPFRFHYVPDRTFINAFALPGGHVFIGAGLMEQMKTEDELASVLAHEIEHVDHYHCAERLQIEAALRKIPLSTVLEIPISVFQAGYSKDQELEADREGVLLAASSGYSAKGAVRTFEMLAKLLRDTTEAARTPQQEAARVAADVLSGYFRSHPEPADRIAQVRAMIASQPALAATPERNLGVEYIFLTWQSLDALSQEKFAVAAQLATQALQKHPEYAAANQALCEADYGLAQYAVAEHVYRDLVARDTAAADAVEKWAEQRAEALRNAKQYGGEIALVESLLTVQPSNPRLLRLSAWAFAMNGDLTAASAKCAEIRRLYRDVALQLAGDTEKSGSDLLVAHDFARAAAMSSLALVLDPSRRTANHTLGDAEFAQAYFAAAADAYRNGFDEETSDLSWLRSFADALGAARPASAAAELDGFLSKQYPKTLDSATVRVEIAGLALLSGNDSSAHDVVQLVDHGSIAPELLGRLGWWYLRAHRAAEAEGVLRKAMSVRPGNAEVKNALAWTEFEETKAVAPSAASEYSESDPLLANSPDVRDALVAWQEGRKGDALRNWNYVAQSKPQWLNPMWRVALYPPRINATALQLEGERRRADDARRAAFKAAMSRHRRN